MGIQSWISGLIKPIVEDAVKTAVDEAISDIKADITVGFNDVERQFLALPTKIVGVADSDVKELIEKGVPTAESIASQVKDEVTQLIQNLNPFRFGG